MSELDDNINLAIRAKPWKRRTPPQRILAIRLHAMGDVIITLPYLRQLKNILPSAKIDLLTIEECVSIPRNVDLFDKIHVIRGGRNLKWQILYAIFLIPELFVRRYEVILDLQDSLISRGVRKIICPEAWTIFERFYPLPAGERTRLTMEAVGLGKINPCAHFNLKSPLNTKNILVENGWDQDKKLIVLNPAGAFETRNWPLENYVEFAKSWLAHFPNFQFLVMGVSQIEKKASYFKLHLKDDLINIVSKTTPDQAFAILQKTELVVTEDSGLMHMSWVSGIPTLALFGSTRSYHAKPLGEKSFLFHSGDLPCGNCMLESCKYGDTHCLTRISPEMIFRKALDLIGPYAYAPELLNPVINLSLWFQKITSSSPLRSLPS
jgi:heptosyltransferase-2